MDTSLSLLEISQLSKIPLEALQSVFNRGIGAYKTNPESVRVKGTFIKDPSVPISQKLSKEQWAYARVYAFVMKTQKVYYDADNDIRESYGLK
jgi:uncharacterized protein (DUF2132 family)